MIMCPSGETCLYADRCYSRDTMNTQFNVLICMFNISDISVLRSTVTYSRYDTAK